MIEFTTDGDNSCHRLDAVRPTTTLAGGTDVVTLTRMAIKRTDRIREIAKLAVILEAEKD